MEFIPFPSIEAFRHLSKCIEYVKFWTPPERLTFRGTVKLHGTHADIFHDSRVQSRNRILTCEHDNDGCALFFSKRRDAVASFFDRLAERAGTRELMVAGEYCGRGIQSKVAICKLPRMFVAFGIKRLDTDTWLDFSLFRDIDVRESEIYNVYLAPTYEVGVELADTDAAAAQMDAITADVDHTCPFAAVLGVQGPGEGVVWTCLERPASSRLWFKTKGRTHVTPVVVEKMGMRNNDIMDALVAPMMSTERMQQGLEYLRGKGSLDTTSMQHINVFSEWVCDDLIKDEADVFEKSEIPLRDIRKAAKSIACAWYKQQTTSSCIPTPTLNLVVS